MLPGEAGGTPEAADPTPVGGKRGRRVFDPECLADRTILVTGASSGLGRAAAIALAACGAKLVLTGRDAARLEQTASRMVVTARHAMIAADLDGADQTADFVRNLAIEHGPLDGIFHSAGAYMAMPVRMTKQRHIEMMFNASVWGAYGVARAVAQKNVMNDGGSILFMSSVAGLRGHMGTSAYAGAKAAVLGIVPALAIELAPRCIRVNSIVAATIETEMHLNTIANLPDALVEEGAARHLLGFGSPNEIANAVIFLMSDASHWITGIALTVDGGYMAK